MTSDDLIQSLVDELQPVRRLAGARHRSLHWAGAAAGCVLLGASLLGFRPDLALRFADLHYIYETAALTLVVVLAAYSAFELSIPSFARDRKAQLAAAAALATWLVQLAVATSAESAASTALAVFWSSGRACVSRTAVLAFGPGLGLLWMLRRAAPLERNSTGFFSALSAASLATLGTRLICANDAPWHALVWHLGPVLCAALAAGALGRVLLERTSASAR